MEEGFSCEGEFGLLGGGTGGGSLGVAGLFVGGVEKRRSLPTSSSRSSWGVELQRDLMSAASSGVIVIWARLSMASREKFL